MKKFELVLKNEKEKFYKTISWIIIISNIILFVVFFAISGFKKTSFLVFALLTVTEIVSPLIFKKLRAVPRFIPSYITIALGWFFSAYWWMGIMILLLGLMSLASERILVVKVLPEKIIYPSWPEKIIRWEELNNIILKDGLLTIDFKNNKLIQQPIIHADVSEPAFNEFCTEQLNKSELHRQN
jgi:hypothetical protein